ncbi:MAG: Eco57I restriction-modification methylase domain-containing protein, partial [Candidatus Cloacimonetes bacterium]|nr:Eco57I restriction-modification methylase domain-containing protein [Candidatus Cloacimonadota bacterium]
IADHFGNVPFLNGGLFECLDSEYEEANTMHYVRIDGFSDRNDNTLKVPDELFLKKDEEEIDLNTVYGTKNKHYKVRGLLSLLHSYKFTVAENTPVEEEVALDPELLGRVFENLLAAYNPETKSTARHETGSFYTPREIVDYMVDESLIAHLTKALPAQTDKQKEDNELRLRLLLYYSDDEHLFADKEVDSLINALDSMKAIDPACGSGAFLMGLLLKMVYILHKLDAHNEKWKAQQIANIRAIIRNVQHSIQDTKVREENIAKLQASIQDIEETFEDYDFDYSRKLFLIERCIYGSDIQPIAIQITKLRFFISLLVDQYPKPGKTNQGIRALPNLETNLVAANSLIPMELEQQTDIFFDKLFEKFQDDITIIHNEYFSTRGRADKQRIRKAEIQLRQSFSKELEAIDVPIEKAELIARWNPYASNDFAQFFSPKIMFGFANFDIVIANPPYIRQEDIPNKANLQKSGYKVFNSTSDIYTYFYELAHNLLSESGVACYITSNKWLRSKYGTKLRNLLRNNTCIHTLIDFGGYKVFESATVDTNIILYTKNLPTVNYMLDFVNIPSNMKPELLSQSIYNTRSSLIQNKLKDSGWTLADNAILKLKDKIEAAGKPLKDWDITIYRGVLTGCNEAFIIDTPTKERLCAEDTKSAEVIRPILRGRDISRYQYKWAGLWIIIIESGWTDANRNGADPETFLRSLYPAVYNHFQRHLSNVNDGAMKSRGKGLIDRDDQGDYWWELRDCAYYDEFEKEKIVWADIAQGSCFQYDDEGLYLNNTVYMLTGKKLKLLLSVLNSKVYDFYFRMISSGLSNQASRGFKIFVEQFPIPCLDDDNITKQLDQLATQITSACNEPENTTSTEAKLNVKTLSHKIDQLVYQLFGLTDEEIAIVEGVAEK